MALIPELKRRNIFRVTILYIVVAWLLLQLCYIAASAAGEIWVYRFMLAMLVICFPLLLIFSWIFELTPDGLKRERHVRREDSITRQTGRRLNRAILYTLGAAGLLELVQLFVG